MAIVDIIKHRSKTEFTLKVESGKKIKFEIWEEFVGEANGVEETGIFQHIISGKNRDIEFVDEDKISYNGTSCKSVEEMLELIKDLAEDGNLYLYDYEKDAVLERVM